MFLVFADCGQEVEELSRVADRVVAFTGPCHSYGRLFSFFGRFIASSPTCQSDPIPTTGARPAYDVSFFFVDGLASGGNMEFT